MTQKAQQISVDNISRVKNGISLVKNVSFTLKSGELSVLLGPNGAGKTSLLRALLGLDPASAGAAKLNGENIAHMPPLKRARQIAYLPQMRPLAWPSRAADIVSLGRFAYGANPARLGEADQAAVDKAIADCGLTALQNRRADTLSGGELARLHCARAFAAQAPFLLADEPVAALDPQHQFRILDLIRSFVDGGGSALVILHDISLAARYADQILWMKDGALLAKGPPQHSLTAARIAEVYGVKAEIKDGHINLSGRL
jgi:iron complex transport system ATP-binding protein